MQARQAAQFTDSRNDAELVVEVASAESHAWTILEIQVIIGVSRLANVHVAALPDKPCC